MVDALLLLVKEVRECKTTLDNLHDMNRAEVFYPWRQYGLMQTLNMKNLPSVEKTVEELAPKHSADMAVIQAAQPGSDPRNYWQGLLEDMALEWHWCSRVTPAFFVV